MGRAHRCARKAETGKKFGVAAMDGNEI